MKIDLVYLWCDGSDREWATRRATYLPKGQYLDAQSFSTARVANNDELRYSLRSVETNAAWINHIYIVTDRQRPEWLDQNSEKVSIVDHTEIFPEGALPCYNSCAIELCIPSINGLSEHFLIANDDTLFAQPVTPDFFFTTLGKVRARFTRTQKIDLLAVEGRTYESTILRASQTIAQDFGTHDMVHWQPHHNIDSYRKSSVLSCIERYREWSSATIRNRFRTPHDMQRHILSLYAVATGAAEASFVDNKLSLSSAVRQALTLLGLASGRDSRIFGLSRSFIGLRLLLSRPKLICLNDDENATDADRQRAVKLLVRLFPQRSSFERSGL